MLEALTVVHLLVLEDIVDIVDGRSRDAEAVEVLAHLAGCSVAAAPIVDNLVQLSLIHI